MGAFFSIQAYTSWALCPRVRPRGVSLGLRAASPYPWPIINLIQPRST